ncbi:MAG: hypothetical protein V3T31_00035, partial [candidate division Zixibacteria bacterium]
APSGSNRKELILPMVAAAMIMIPLSYIPVYSDSFKSEKYVSSYLDRHDSYYRTGCLSFRDAFFYIDEFDQANFWERSFSSKSPDLINYEGASFLIGGGQRSDGITALYQLITRNPYWAAPRSLLVRTQLMLGQLKQARPQIDTCLLLEPFNRQYRIHDYEFYRALGAYDQAIVKIQEALQLFPEDQLIMEDLMILSMLSGDPRNADSLAAEILGANPDAVYPYWVRALVFDRSGDTTRAIEMYEKFLEMGPDGPDSVQTLSRLMKLRGITDEQP